MQIILALNVPNKELAKLVKEEGMTVMTVEQFKAQMTEELSLANAKQLCPGATASLVIKD